LKKKGGGGGRLGGKDRIRRRTRKKGEGKSVLSCRKEGGKNRVPEREKKAIDRAVFPGKRGKKGGKREGGNSFISSRQRKTN